MAKDKKGDKGVRKTRKNGNKKKEARERKYIKTKVL